MGSDIAIPRISPRSRRASICNTAVPAAAGNPHPADGGSGPVDPEDVDRATHDADPTHGMTAVGFVRTAPTSSSASAVFC